jgi:hypothetical protein
VRVRRLGGQLPAHLGIEGAGEAVVVRALDRQARGGGMAAEAASMPG